ncbi:family 78 glycoside hydrolase catalytic domain [Niveispirillum fermenti]|uniref:family 78 glycoside hydrolase catalytic domain n=2 Tax=Niveispirillum fermenti TaxID=1233113 RepID=UPI003A89EFCA
MRDDRRGEGRRQALKGRLQWAACTAVLVLAGCGTPGNGPPQGLRVEYAVTPIGLDEQAPRLAWLSPVARQSAYRIRVAQDPAALETGPLAWDSGKVASGDNVHIPYAGHRLAAGTRYWWQVMVWDANGRPGAWSPPDWWEMGLLDADQWQAGWISGPDQTVHDWSDLELDIDLTLKGTALDILFRARGEGKKFGEAYVWTLTDTKDGPTLVQSVRRYGGGKSGGMRTTELARARLPGGPLKDRRLNLSVRARGQEITTILDGVQVARLTDPTQTHGTVGFTARQADAAVIHGVRVGGTGSPEVKTIFAGNDNPFTGGNVGADGLRVAAGVPSVDIVLPLGAPAPLLRRTFALPDKPVARARLYWAGAGMPRLLLNGSMVGATSLGAGFTAYDKRVLAYVEDVTDRLRPGDNVVAAELGRGWYGVTDPNEWYFHRAPWHADPALLARLEIDFADGTRQVVTSDGDWRSQSGPTLSDSVYRGERHDARLTPDGWKQAGFDDTGWVPARRVPGPAGTIDFANVEPIAPVATIQPVEMREVQPGIWVYDFGRIISGLPVLKANGPRGTTISLVAAEKLDDAGLVAPASGLINAQLQTYRYILAGTGTERWSPRFGYAGFRYIQVEGLTGPPAHDMLTAEIVHSAVADTGSFASANPLLDRIDAAARASILNNLHGFLTDTPTYEKNGWTGDAQASAGMAVRSLDVARVFTKWLADFRDAQADSGEVPEVIPTTPFYGYQDTPGWNLVWGPTPPWDVAALILPWELYTTYGDTRVLAENHAMQRRLVDYTATIFKAPDYRGRLGLSEWSPPGPLDILNARGGGIDAVTSAYFFLEADLLARSSAVIGADGDAARYRALANAIRAAYNARYWDAGNGWYRTMDGKGVAGPPTQIQNVLPLAFGMVPDGQEASVAAAIAADAEKNGLRTGVFGTRYLLEVLSDHGHADLAYRIATRTDEPGWGWWIENGHQTMFETWSLNSRSRNHHYFSSIGDWMRTRLAGLRPGDAGYKRVLVRPEIPDGLAWAEATMQTVHGRAASAWRVENGALTLTVQVPANSVGDIWVPRRFGPVRAVPKGARRTGGNDRFTIYSVEPGTHRFTTEGAR